MITQLEPKNFERDIAGKQTSLFSISNGKLKAVITNYGARILILQYEDINVTPAYPSLEPYISSTIAPYHGATIGRYANRIAKGQFSLNGKEFKLPINNAPNHLHGGPEGFHTQVWNIIRTKPTDITFSHFSKDGSEGYPGNLNVTVSYSLTSSNELEIKYTAKSTESTPFNITNHAFFNLNGEGSILDHQLQINADQFNPVDSTLIPKGSQKVEGTAFDFRELKKIGKHINNEEEQIKIGGGYDHNFILNKQARELSFAGKAIRDRSGIVMEVFTEEPGMQLFSGNFETVKGDP